MTADECLEPARAGRPRLLDPEIERRLLLDAGMTVMSRRGFTAANVNEVLREAGLSTRAFYRHFPTSQDLVRALFEREVASATRWLERATASADGPLGAIGAWIDASLDMHYDPKRAARSSALTSPRFAFYLEERPDGITRFCRPLAEALRQGHASGVLYSPSPEDDALSIHGLITAASAKHGGRQPSREAARAQVVRMAWPALRIGTPPAGS